MVNLVESSASNGHTNEEEFMKDSINDVIVFLSMS